MLISNIHVSLCSINLYFENGPGKKCIWKRICQIHQIRRIKYKYKYKYMVWNLIKYKYKYNYAVFVFVFVFANTNTYLTPALVQVMVWCWPGPKPLPEVKVTQVYWRLSASTSSLAQVYWPFYVSSPSPNVWTFSYKSAIYIDSTWKCYLYQCTLQRLLSAFNYMHIYNTFFSRPSRIHGRSRVRSIYISYIRRIILPRQFLRHKWYFAFVCSMSY